MTDFISSRRSDVLFRVELKGRSDDLVFTPRGSAPRVGSFDLVKQEVIHAYRTGALESQSLVSTSQFDGEPV